MLLAVINALIAERALHKATSNPIPAATVRVLDA